MKNVLISITLYLICCTNSFASTYYFKDCTLSNAVSGDYVININKNVIEVMLKSIEGNVQNFSDKIKKIDKNQVISEKIKSTKGDAIYYQYFLNAKAKSVIKQEYRKESGDDFSVFKLLSKKVSYCKDVKINWDVNQIQETKTNVEQKQVLKAQEKIKKEQSEIIKCQDENYQLWTNCQGIHKAESGHKYDGIFKDGQIIRGISIYPGGAKYVGEFRDFKPDGYGTFVWVNKDKYYGEWKNGQSHGNGTKTWSDGRKYSGQFKTDKIHGEGVLTYPDGKKYVGGFINGKRHGEGTFTYEDGTAFIGKFVAGIQQGKGECVGKDGTSSSCINEKELNETKYSNKDTKDISIVAKKWIRISHYETESGKGKKILDKLKFSFDEQAQELCAAKGSYKVLEKKIEVLEINETPAYGLEAKLKIGINGVVECRPLS